MSDAPVPEAPAAEVPQPEAPAEQATPRRIPIGTQRAGVKPPSLKPKVEYVTSAPAIPASTAGASATAVDPVAEPPAQPLAATTSTPVTEPADGARPSRSGGRGRRDRRGGNESKKSPFADVLPPQKRVAVPNLRADLDEDLEADFAAAVEGIAVDELLEKTAPAQAEKPLEPGQRVTGTVIAIGPDTAFIDLGGRRQGAMKLVGLFNDGEELPVVGQTIEVGIGGRNEEDGLYEVAPANRAIAVEDWSQLDVGMIVEARVTGTNKGGLECEVGGLRGFMPAGAVSPWRVENLEEMVGQTLESLVTELVPAARRLVLSRRAVIERQAADARTKMLETLDVGDQFDGIVRSVRDFGAFVDIGNGVEGLVHVSQLSWERVANPADVMQPGQKVRVVVKKVDRQTGKIALSARDLIESPWAKVADKYHTGATVKGTVSRIADFGAFVRLEPGVEGLVHVSELASRRVRSVADVVKEGQAVECRVLSVDPDEQRMSLSIKALEAKPAEPAGDQESVDSAEPIAEEPAPVKRKRTTPLKGGLGSPSDGARFGLKW
jgi:predicted RNA-binding protein with RPS1 domain